MRRLSLSDSRTPGSNGYPPVAQSHCNAHPVHGHTRACATRTITLVHADPLPIQTFHGTYSFLDSPVPMVKWLHAKRMRLGFYCTGDLVTVVESSPLFLQALLSMLPSVTTLQIAVVCEGGHQVSATYEQRVRRFADTFASSLQSGSDLHNRLTVQYVGIIPPPEEL